MRKKPSAFPVGLYGMLLFALCWLTLPGVFAPLERLLLGVSCSVVRAWARLAGEPVAAASPGARERLAQLTADLAMRVREHDERDAPDGWARGASPVHCAVVARERRKGGGGEILELRLDRTYAELAGCRALVTKGGALVGFLQQPGVGVAANDGPDDLARVLLPNHPDCRPLHAEVATEDGGLLRFVVRAAAAVDPAPLRVDLWDDPYRAARMGRAGLPVMSRELVGGDDVVPAGLRIGSTRIWGYSRTDGGPSLTLGVFVTPAIVASALSHVVLWRDASAARELGADEQAPRVPWHTGVVHELPGAVHGRYLLVGAGVVADGVAVVQDGCLLGTAKGLSLGTALVTSFAASRQPWSLVVLPDDATAMPIELAGEVVGADGDQVRLRATGQCVATPGLRPATGHLFTGSNGLHCPAGLWIGRVAADPLAFDRWIVTVPVARGARIVEVQGAGGGP
jgi:hypothetical protein